MEDGCLERDHSSSSAVYQPSGFRPLAVTAPEMSVRSFVTNITKTGADVS